jgi:lysophospholipase L1-like esterase
MGEAGRGGRGGSVASRIARTAGGLLFASIVFLVAGEVLARATGLVDRLNGYARQLFAAGPSADLPYVLRPDLETPVAGHVVRVNQLGLRGPETSSEPAAGVLRVLVLGDSVVFGQGVDEDATFPAVLASRLAARRGGEVEALNAGVQGYDTVAEAAFLGARGLALGPGAIVVGMSLNDYDMAPGYDATGVLTRRDPGDAPPDLLARSEFVLLLRWLYAWSRGRLMTQVLTRAAGQSTPAIDANVAAAVDRAVAAEHLRFYHDPEPARWARVRDGLTRMRDLARAGGVALVVAVFPESYQVGVAEPDTTPQQRILALCADVGVRCIDLLPAFRAASGPLFQDAQHPNAHGLAIAADRVAEALAP